jgi:hypothetical protein
VKPDVANRESATQKDDACSIPLRQSSGCNLKSYASRLRALGQALEKFGFLTFDLKIRNGTYLVVAKTHPRERTRDSIARFVNESFREASFRSGLMNPGRQVTLRFSSADVEHFDRHGKNRRRDPGKIPDPYSISQLLRGAGCFLDHLNEVKHIAISLLGRWVTVRYQTLQAGSDQIDRDLDCFYDYWIEMYLRRSSCVELVAPTEPTVLVTGQNITNASLAKRPLRIKHNGTQISKNGLA